ncbi:MAG: helix-turn-helix domain-containing protein [Bdellovibrionales bacterium]|nr:helix-turn-helix domain-containing protein [Bdellovibrionales bacterium]
MKNPVRQLRMQAHLTQSELAQRGSTSQPTIAAYEADMKSPTVATLIKIAKGAGLETIISYTPKFTREDSRSLAYHEAIGSKLQADSDAMINKARANLKTLRNLHPDARALLDLWEAWLSLPLESLLSCMLSVDLLGRDMRQVTPFSGALSARERLNVIKNFRREFAR